MAAASPILRSANTVTYEIKDSVFQARIKKNFHFNEKAPNSLLIDGKPQLLRALLGEKIEFKLSPTPWKNAAATLYVCDDALTFCEEQTIDLLRDQSRRPEKKDRSEPPVLTSTPSKLISHDKHNFLLNNFDHAVRVAKKSKKLIFVDFSADWCPGCIRLDQEVFAAKSFQKLASDFVFLKIDTDLPQNKALRDLYRVRGIPALLILNSEGKEILRLNDYQPFAEIENQVREVKKDSRTIDELATKPPPLDPNTALRLGMRIFAQGNPKTAVFYLEQVAPQPAELLEARIEIAKQAEEISKLIEALKRAIKLEPDSTRSLAWRISLVKLLQGEKKDFAQIYQEGRALGNNLLQNEKAVPLAVKTDRLGEYFGYERLYIAILVAELSEAANQPLQTVKAAWVDVYKIGQSYAMGASQMGPATRLLALLTSQQMWTEADDFSDKLLISSPKNVDLQRRKVKILKELKKYKQAIQLGQSILSQVKGPLQNQLREDLESMKLLVR